MTDVLKLQTEPDPTADDAPLSTWSVTCSNRD